MLYCYKLVLSYEHAYCYSILTLVHSQADAVMAELSAKTQKAMAKLKKDVLVEKQVHDQFEKELKGLVSGTPMTYAPHCLHSGTTRKRLK